MAGGILIGMLLSFTKMHGLGNDFVVVDNRGAGVALDAPLARRLADRKLGIGFDQLLLLEHARRPGADLAMRIFNADGGEVEHCGNGARALARYAVRRGLAAPERIVVDLQRGQVMASVDASGLVTIDMGEPAFQPANVPFVTSGRAAVYTVPVDGESLELGVVSMGNPHALIRVEDVDAFDLARFGRALQAHPAFPERVNFGAVQVLDHGNVRARVFERGVGETAACGTGACAALAVLRDQGLAGSDVTVHLRGGPLAVSWQGSGTPLYMSGPAEFVYDGEIEL